jgi:hypothetical protein
MRVRIMMLVVVVTAACVPLTASETQQAAVAVAQEGGRIYTACVTFSEPELTGVQLLERSGLTIGMDAGNSAGVLVCSIDGLGCNYPTEDCFCQCSGGGTCTYWAYFNQSPEGRWTYAPLGASGRKVHQGDVDLWAWISSGGVGDFNAEALPSLTFEEICQTEAAD